MSIEECFGIHFKPEIKTSGAKLIAHGKIAIQSSSDSEAQAYVRMAPPSKVRLCASAIGSGLVLAQCSCPMARKSQFCKHVWATLLIVEQRAPDFLRDKQSLEKPAVLAEDSKRVEINARAVEYRKIQYQRQKLHAKELKSRRRAPKASIEPAAVHASLPAEIVAALSYFSQNGFPMPLGPTESIVGEAKRKLSRVFHPDWGGTNEEAVELNRNCDLILGYVGNKPRR